MKILISGSHGLVGSALAGALEGDMHAVLKLVRHAPQSDSEIEWQPDAPLEPARLEGIDAVVHLAGESIASGRWTDDKKRRIRDSRVTPTQLLSESLAAMTNPPHTFISASAIGYYGDRGDEVLTESSSPGDDFLAHVCRDWELATAPAAESGIRVIKMRFGVILDQNGGALAKMLPPFRMGIGGRVGDGRQWMSWIALQDAVGALRSAVENRPLSGPVNVVAPNPVTNAEFTRTVGSVLGRPTIFPIPAFAAKLVFGEMAEALLLSGQRVEPRELKDAGYEFQLPTLKPALQRILT